jgi:hypothetical protein
MKCLLLSLLFVILSLAGSSNAASTSTKGSFGTLRRLFFRSNTLIGRSISGLSSIDNTQEQSQSQSLSQAAPLLLKKYVIHEVEKSLYTFSKQQRILRELKIAAGDALQIANSCYHLVNEGVIHDNDAVSDFLIKWMIKYPNFVQFGIYSYGVYSIYRSVYYHTYDIE